MTDAAHALGFVLLGVLVLVGAFAPTRACRECGLRYRSKHRHRHWG